MSVSYAPGVERWGMFEVRVSGPDAGNPFTGQSLNAVFTGEHEQVRAEGFYDGEGSYAVRFMPSYEGRYSFKLKADFLSESVQGEFTVSAARGSNHGPVHVSGMHFDYADGTPYYSVGTTCYVWELQSDELIEETLVSLKESGFNKIRFCVFPKHYVYNLHEPRSYPYEGTPMDSSVLTTENFGSYIGACAGNDWQFDRFNPEHFRHIERCIMRLMELGVEADIILWHPYDRWGFSCMTRAQDEMYLRYVVNRFSALRNVWWAMANEYDLMRAKTVDDWEYLANLLMNIDPYGHPRSIHNCMTMYDHSRPWVTHCSIQRMDLYKGAELTNEWRDRYHKPVVLDEIAYEGDIQHGWGNITGQEMIRRFWETAMRGGYPGHGETFLNHGGILWWSHGGKLYGESWKRVNFLKQILSETPGHGLKYEPQEWDSVCAVPEDAEEAARTGYRIYYYTFMRPAFREFHMPDDTRYSVDVIDTWNMTVTPMGVFSGSFNIPLGAGQYMAIRLRKADA